MSTTTELPDRDRDAAKPDRIAHPEAHLMAPTAGWHQIYADLWWLMIDPEPTTAEPAQPNEPPIWHGGIHQRADTGKYSALRTTPDRPRTQEQTFNSRRTAESYVEMTAPEHARATARRSRTAPQQPEEHRARNRTAPASRSREDRMSTTAAYAAISLSGLTSCGHWHPTEAEAQECADEHNQQLRDSAARWGDPVNQRALRAIQSIPPRDHEAEEQWSI